MIFYQMSSVLSFNMVPRVEAKLRLHSTVPRSDLPVEFLSPSFKCAGLLLYVITAPALVIITASLWAKQPSCSQTSVMNK